MRSTVKTLLTRRWFAGGSLMSLMTFCLPMIGLAADAKVELLWPNGAPLAKGESDNDKPTVAIYPAPKETAALRPRDPEAHGSNFYLASDDGFVFADLALV